MFLNQCHQLDLIMTMLRCANCGAITCFKNGFGRRRWKSLLKGEDNKLILRNLHRAENNLILLKRVTNWFLAQCPKALKVSRPIKSLWTILENHPRPFLGKSNKMCLSALKLSRQNSENSHVIKFFSHFINFSLLCKMVDYIIKLLIKIIFYDHSLIHDMRSTINIPFDRDLGNIKKYLKMYGCMSKPLNLEVVK